MSGYDEAYYLRPHSPEFWFGRQGLLRPDQLAAVCYLWALPFWGYDIQAWRDPKQVLSIGAGEGILEAWMETRGVSVIGVDTSEAARKLYRGKMVVPRLTEPLMAWADSVILVESLEHIPRDELEHMKRLVHPGMRLVTVNWPDYFPLAPSGWEHITALDDDLFDFLAEGGTTVMRRGSHLVVDF